MKRAAVLMLLIVVTAACETSPIPTRPSGRVTPVTLSGVVSSVTSRGAQPLTRAEVWTSLTTPDPSSWSLTDASGRYRITVHAATLTVFADAEGYETQSKSVTATQDTTLDFELRPNH